MVEYSVVVFHSAAHAIRAEKVLTQAGFKIKMIPTPRQISSDCGLALRFTREQEQQVTAALMTNRVPTNGIHPI